MQPNRLTCGGSVLTRYEHIQEVFKDSDKHLKAVDNNSGYLLSQLLGQCVGLISHDEWKRVRAVCEGPFIRSSAIGYVEIVNRQTHRHFKELQGKSELFAQFILDPTQELKMLPFWIIAEILYGDLTAEMQATLRLLAPLREELFQNVIRGGLTRFHWSKYLPTVANSQIREFQAQWSAFNLHARDRAIEKGIDAPIVQMYEALASKRLSMTQLLHTLDELLFVNLDVTVGAISWNLIFLAAHADVYDRLRNEIAAKRQASEKNPSVFDAYLMSSQSFLSACISESARLRPLAAFSVPQAAPTGRVVGGYFFPAGTNFIVDSYALNQRNPFWGADATIYRPARFLEQDSIQARYNFWRFGFGPRQCLGKSVADLIIRALLVHLAEGYDLSLLKTGAAWEHDPETWIHLPQMQLRCEPRTTDP